MSSIILKYSININIITGGKVPCPSEDCQTSVCVQSQCEVEGQDWERITERTEEEDIVTVERTEEENVVTVETKGKTQPMQIPVIAISSPTELSNDLENKVKIEVDETTPRLKSIGLQINSELDNKHEVLTVSSNDLSKTSQTSSDTDLQTDDINHDGKVLSGFVEASTNLEVGLDGSTLVLQETDLRYIDDSWNMKSRVTVNSRDDSCFRSSSSSVILEQNISPVESLASLPVSAIKDKGNLQNNEPSDVAEISKTEEDEDQNDVAAISSNKRKSALSTRSCESKLSNGEVVVSLSFSDDAKSNSTTRRNSEDSNTEKQNEHINETIMDNKQVDSITEVIPRLVREENLIFMHNETPRKGCENVDIDDDCRVRMLSTSSDGDKRSHGNVPSIRVDTESLGITGTQIFTPPPTPGVKSSDISSDHMKGIDCGGLICRLIWI